MFFMGQCYWGLFLTGFCWGSEIATLEVIGENVTPQLIPIHILTPNNIIMQLT